MEPNNFTINTAASTTATGPLTLATVGAALREEAALVRARFSLSETARVNCYGKNSEGQWMPREGCRVKLMPVLGEPFGSATPSGSMEMIIVNPAAAAIFQGAPLGQEFDVRISLAEEE